MFWVLTMTRQCFIPIPQPKKRETQISETRQQVKKKNPCSKKNKKKGRANRSKPE